MLEKITKVNEGLSFHESGINNQVTKPKRKEIRDLLKSENQGLNLGDILLNEKDNVWYAVATEVVENRPVGAVIPIITSDTGLSLGKKTIIISASCKTNDIFSTYLQSISCEKGGDNDRNKKKKPKGQSLYRKKTDDERMKLERNSILTNAGVFDTELEVSNEQTIEASHQITKNKGVYFS